MLTQTFCHLKGISRSAERKLWMSGILCWNDLIRSTVNVFSEPKMRELRLEIRESEAALKEDQFQYFLDLLPVSEQVRLYPHLRSRVAYLDIETTDLSRSSEITTIALYDGRILRVYVRGWNLERFVGDVGQYELLVTYNGKKFDLPFLVKRFGRLPVSLHLDLCPILHAWGCYGGLKAAEITFGIRRDKDTKIDGSEAVILWHRYERLGERSSLERLVRYNIQDVLSLESLLIRLYNRSMSSCPIHRRMSSSKQPQIESSFLEKMFSCI
jgi:uncharacterized protein YprB with RNaseH-like and TPR domain